MGVVYSQNLSFPFSLLSLYVLSSSLSCPLSFVAYFLSNFFSLLVSLLPFCHFKMLLFMFGFVALITFVVDIFTDCAEGGSVL